ncbi:inactive tyrosine-protein kinase PEAK1 isoform X1 [Neopsephotus bourkii]|uniref:inactive tyrosine-protein kinase PEAK1 isoform X1 n=1 Tax=Neopsephotus bourkii TaxID=309878 RepID=UPI002AA56452|nr:inactive tyrosine-protein kinase PEAK1 isoform X1 [Neopsephotus bourkii]XP_061203678.1 inactive tyrosine-protein kinase PEAK1 isoform X1 [Neopsephotus bourkii]XP_061203679.1 inactive tyrosine-protein kinase PEAK1 isoform X1 [Neopsephotus bourkii]XP_061203680.1 inactive tyrosine-protein kinase PEAK1 isoform X1 [Neopsephotus bourkii]
MSACSTFTEHVWKPGECKNCFKPKSLHQLPPVSEKKTLSHANLKANANQSNSQRGRNTGSFRPPVAKKPTIAVKPTMMVVDGQGVCGEISTLDHCENKAVPAGWNRNKAVLNKKPLNNNNEDEIEGYSHVHRPYGNNDGVGKIPNNNNNGLTEVLKEIAGLDSTPQLTGSETSSRETFLGRINNCYKKSLDRKIPPSCMMGGMKDSHGKHVILSGSTEVISNEGGRFCYPEFSSGDESEDDTFFGSMQEEHESWDESDEELLAMEIRMRGQPRFANFRANTLSPVQFGVDKKWNTVPLRNKSLQRICAVDYDDSYDEILNGYGEEAVILYGQESMQSMVSSDSTSPDSSLTEESRSGTTSSSSQKLCNGGLSPSTPQDLKLIEPEYESLCDSQQVKDVSKAPRNVPKGLETHKAVLALRLEEKDGKIAVQTDKQENKGPSDVAGQAVTINLVPVEEQAKPYRVVNMEQPVCKPYTIVDVSAAMTNECKENQPETSETKNTSSNPSSPVTPGTPITSSAASPVRVNANLKKSSAIRYQEVWTSSTSPRQKIPKVELISNSSGPSVPPRKTSHKSAPTSPTATNISSKTIPVKSPNLSEIKFNSYNNAGMPPFPIIIHDEPTYAKSSKNAIKVPIVINPNAYDNLAIYKSFLGTSGELSIKDKTTSVISHTYEEIETESKMTEAVGSKPSELSQAKGLTNSSECRLGSVAQKVQEFNSCLGKSQISPQRSHSSDHSSPPRVQKTTPEPAAKPDLKPEASTGSSSGRENASTVLSQIVASIQPPQSPPETPQSGPKSCSVEELYSLPPDGDATKNTLVRPKSLFTSQSEIESSKTVENTAIKMQKDSLSQPVVTHSPKPVRASPNTTSPKTEQAPPFPPPRSTSSPYHASNLLQKHFSNWSKPNSPTRSTEAESILHSEGRRAADAKPKRWISFKSFFRRRKADDEEDKEKEREKGKLVGLDGTVIHMLPPPPVQRHHWFTEAKSDSSEKPSIVFMYRCEPAQAEPKAEHQNKSGVESAIADVLARDKGETQEKSAESLDQKPVSHSSPPQIPKKIPSTSEHCGINGSPEFQDMIKRLKKALKEFPLMGNCVSEYSGQVPDDTTLEDLSPRVPRAVFVKQDNGGSASVIPVSSLRGPQAEEEKEETSNSPDLNACSATYSNLGQSRAAMIPPKQPRQPKGALDDAIAFGGLVDQETMNILQPTPPPLPKKTILRANTEPTPRDLQKQALENNLCIVANPTYDIDTNWEASSACSSVSLELKILDNESGDSLDRPTEKLRATTSATNSVSSLTTISIKDRCSNSMESLTGRRISHTKQGKGVQKPQRQALYRGIENREEVVGKIRSLHADSLKKLALKCEDLFMAGQKDQLRFGVDSWSDFRLTSDKPCCEAGDAVYYPASYAKDPLNNYAVKICKSKAKESQQYYHSLSIRQSLAINFNIQQDCGHFLAEVPVRLLPWEDADAPEVEEEEQEEEEKEPEQKNRDTPASPEASQKDSSSNQGTISKPRSRVVVITREVPYLTVADFVRESAPRHAKSPDLYERQVCLLLLQLCLGLEHLKPYHITHCDLRLENLLLVHSRPGSSPLSSEAMEPSPNTACPARLIVSNFSQAKQKSHMVDPEVLRDQSRLAPEIITATQYKKCDEFQTGILIYEMLHLPNPFDENPELKEKEYTRADLPKIPCRSLYSQGLQQLASCLLNPNPSERILISEAKGVLQCLLWGPREDLFHALSTSSNPSRRDAVLQNWLDIKRTLLMIKFAEKSLDRDCGVILEDWLCCQYLAFATTDSLHRIVRIMQQH